MSAHFCTFCSKCFSSNSSLKRHQETNKICLENQREINIEKHICKFCNKEYTTQYVLKNHYLSCKYLEEKINYREEINNYKTQILLLEKDKENLQNNYNDLKIKYEKLENEFKENMKSIQKDLLDNPKIINNNNTTYTNSNNTNNNLTYKQIVSKLEPITDEGVKESMQFLSNDLLDKGLRGFAHFLCNFSYNSKFITTDSSRRTISYRTNFDEFIRDPECLLLINSTLKNNADEILEKARSRRQHLLELFEASEDTEELEDYSNKRDNVYEIILLTKSAVKDTPDENIKKISNILINHGLKNLNKEKNKLDIDPNKLGLE